MLKVPFCFFPGSQTVTSGMKILFAIYCLHAGAETETETTTASLIIPLGSYLERIPAHKLFILEGQDGPLLRTSAYNHPFDLLQCWQDGYDITAITSDQSAYITCNQEVRRDRIVNAADFLYSSLIPSGPYLKLCTGIIRTREQVDDVQRAFLYATCIKAPGRPFHTDRDYLVTKLDITNCSADRLVSIDGKLTCQETPETRLKVAFGSYLKQGCDITVSRYDEASNRLYTRCDKMNYQLDDVSQCINAGSDIVFSHEGLTCLSGSSTSASLQTSSAFIPPGNYTVSCTSIAYYPCAGPDRQGVLAARCRGLDDKYQSSMLMDANDRCSMANMGYISNIDGELVCDPDIPFNDEVPEEGSSLNQHLRCDHPQ